VCTYFLYLIHDITKFLTRLIRRVPLVEQELLTLQEHLRSSPVFSRVGVTRSLVLYVCFVDRCLSFCTFSFGHCVVCSSSKYGFWLPIWYLQTLLLSIRWLKTYLSEIKHQSINQPSIQFIKTIDVLDCFIIINHMGIYRNCLKSSFNFFIFVTKKSGIRHWT
jgi:hypothetical protein